MKRSGFNWPECCGLIDYGARFARWTAEAAVPT